MTPLPPGRHIHGRVVDLPRPEFPVRICILVEERLWALPLACPAPAGLAVGDLVRFSVTTGGDVASLVRTGGPPPGGWDQQGDGLRWRRPGAAVPRAAWLRVRHGIVRELRGYFDGEGFLEVETPTLGLTPNPEPQFRSIPAGEGYLVTSPEFHLKRMLVGGWEKVYRLGPVFRGGESGAHHNPEFTLVEWYRAHEGLEAMAGDLESLLGRLAPLAASPGHGAPGNPALAETLAHPCARATVAALFHQHLGMEVGGVADLEALRRAARQAGVAEAERLGPDFEAAFFSLWQRIEPHLPPHPLLVVDWPAPLASLARLRDDDPTLAERMELYAGGLELANGFAELTDPAEQRRRFEANLAARRAQGLPQGPLDERFLAALQQGMPAAAGMALGVDRLVMLIAGAGHIRDVLPFAWEER